MARKLEESLGPVQSLITMHWSGCPAGCGNHQAADVGFRGLRANIGGEIVDAVTIYTGGKTGPDAVAGREVLEVVPCDERLPEIVAGIVRERERLKENELQNPDPTGITSGIRISSMEAE
jgi:ferredoxin-nitrite reductase